MTHPLCLGISQTQADWSISSSGCQTPFASELVPPGPVTHALHIGYNHTATHRHQSTDISINQSISQSINQSINQSVNQSINQSISQSINQSINQSISQSVNQSISQSVNQSINQSINELLIHGTHYQTTSHQHQLLYHLKQDWSMRGGVNQ